jgi:hypothetical protein
MGPNGGSLTMERSFDGRQSRDNSTVQENGGTVPVKCFIGGDAI